MICPMIISKCSIFSRQYDWGLSTYVFTPRVSSKKISRTRFWDDLNFWNYPNLAEPEPKRKKHRDTENTEIEKYKKLSVP